jgi:hypothetical protein
MLDCNS